MRKNESSSASDPPDAGGSAAHGQRASYMTNASSSSSSGGRSNFKIGIYGWRKRCLYVLILGLLVMVIINLGLTLWVLKVMEFSSEGMGQLKIVAGGLRLEGTAYVLDSLITRRIRSRTGQSIVVESSKNLTLTTRDAHGKLDNIIYLGNDRFECLANNFKVIDDRGHILFSASRDEIVVGSDTLQVTGEGGTTFSGSVQTPLVRADSGHDLRLESPTRTLEIKGPHGVNIVSRAGEIKAMSLNDVKLKSVEGAIRLDASVIVMDKIPTAIPSSKVSQSKNHDIYQLCICNNGKLFLVPPHHYCSDDGIVCR